MCHHLGKFADLTLPTVGERSIQRARIVIDRGTPELVRRATYSVGSTAFGRESETGSSVLSGYSAGFALSAAGLSLASASAPEPELALGWATTEPVVRDPVRHRLNCSTYRGGWHVVSGQILQVFHGMSHANCSTSQSKWSSLGRKSTRMPVTAMIIPPASSMT
jgi:hypothetical protein